MSIVTVIIVIAVVGFLIWAITTYLPMAPPFKNILIGVAVVALVLWLLQVFGVLGNLNATRVGNGNVRANGCSVSGVR